MANELEKLFEAIKRRFEELPEASSQRDSYLAHLRSLSRWHKEPMDYEEIETVSFPEQVAISYAVCHPECGRKEYIVEGSTQECQSCGGIMFRTESSLYKRVKDAGE